MAEAASANLMAKVEIHDRDFQQYSIQNRIYYVPIDDDEEERLELQHRIFDWLLGGRLFLPSIEYPSRILDCGYGQGSWAVQMANTYPDSEVTALDIHPIPLTSYSENLECQFWNLNDRLRPENDEDYYDLIHSRCIGPGVRKNRWESYIRDLRNLLRRDGWAQLAEYYFNFQSDSGRLTEDHALYKWGVLYRRLMDEQLDRDPRVGRRLETLLRQARFRNVESRCFRVPIGTWKTDHTQQRIGHENVLNMDALLDSHAIWPFTHVGARWTKDQVGWLTDEAKQELRNPDLKLYIELYVAWGQR